MSMNTEVAEMPAVEINHRWWMPMTIVGLAAVAGVALMLILPKDFDGGYRNAFNSLIGLLTMLGLTLWAVFFSRFSKWRVLPLLLVMAITPMVLLRITAFYGNGLPKVELSGWVQRVLGIEAQQLLERNRLNNKADGTLADLTDKPGDMPAYRGRNRDGVVVGPPLNLDWEKKTPKMLWKQPIGLGWSAFAEANGFLVTIEQRRGREVVSCYEAKTGKEIWATGWDAEFKEAMGGIGPRATPTIYEGDVYAYGAKGKLLRLKGTNGEILWSVDTLEEGQNVMWAMSGSPLVFEDKVVVCPGVQSGRAEGRGIIAYDRRSGKEIWASGDNQASYSSPMLVTLDGIRQIVQFDGSGCGGYEPADGKPLWYFEWTNPQKINASQPLVIGSNELFVSTGYEIGSVMLMIEKVSLNEQKEGAPSMKATEVLRPRFRDMRSKFSSPGSA